MDDMDALNGFAELLLSYEKDSQTCMIWVEAQNSKRSYP